MSTNRGVYFREKQYFNTAWVWLIALSAESILFAFLLLKYDSLEMRDFSMNDLYLMWGIFTTMFIGLFLLFKMMYIEVVIKEEGVLYKAPPVKNKFITVKPAEISMYKVREYQFIKEIGGRGYNRNIIKNKESLTVTGNIGLEIKTLSGKTIMFGTQRKAAIADAMKKLMKEA